MLGRKEGGPPKEQTVWLVGSLELIAHCRVHTNPERRCTELDMARGKKRGEPCGKTCREDRDDEWMGVSLARQPKADGRVLACAHRWKNIYYETDHILPHGFCYLIPSNLQAKGKVLIPCYEEYKKKYGEEHGSCQAGMAGFFTEELVVMGAPGSFYWAGTVKVLNLTDNTYFKLNDDVIMSRRYTYLGYAVTAGHFSHPSITDVVGGAPQDEGIGKMGSYFGSSLCAVDLNMDGLSDLLVGAPMFSEIRDEGQVTVYLNKGNGALEEQLSLTGDGAYNAHFGESIASLGDLDDDGFPDVAVGAPKEDDFAGAVYIYHGDANGIVPQYSVHNGLQMSVDNLSLHRHPPNGPPLTLSQSQPQHTQETKTHSKLLLMFLASRAEMCRFRMSPLEPSCLTAWSSSVSSLLLVLNPRDQELPVHSLVATESSPVHCPVTAALLLTFLTLQWQQQRGPCAICVGSPGMLSIQQALGGEGEVVMARPVITVDVSIFLPGSINITAPQCHDGQQPVNCLNVTVCFRFHGKRVPGEIDLSYNLTADVAQKEKGQLPRVYFVLLGETAGQVSEKLQLTHMEETCHHYMAHVKGFEKTAVEAVAYVGAESRSKNGGGMVLSYPTPASGRAVKLYRRRGEQGHILAFQYSISSFESHRAVDVSKGEGCWFRDHVTVFERNCRSEDCAADLQLRGKLLLSSVDEKTPYLALGAVKNISLNISISNLGDDAYDANVSFNVSRELFFINMWQKLCEIPAAVIGFFLQQQIYFLVLPGIKESRNGNMERSEALHDNTLTLSVPLVHEVDTSITGIVSPTSFVYGESVDASNFVQLDDQECHFQPLNITLQVYNTGPSTLPGASVSISFPSRLSPGGAEMFQVQEMVVSQEKGNCSFQRNPTPCIIPQEQGNIFHTIFAFFTKSGRKVMDCEKLGSFCLTVRCNLSALPKEESRTIDLYMLLNTEILKKDSSSVIQFMARAKVKVDPALRVVEIANGNAEETLVVFEALHNLEPRGYVVGWIIAISLLVGILIFLLLAVLLWKMGFFRRRYKEIIEAEKNRKENEDGWDWVQKNQ
ncbi:hypothetical protein A6R68_12949 [Neotoma lepida]|uniref:Integrin alpha-2 domain-containing protein n=1 Tax=Neotoma lepida TaxID=56216 RepID=A0A1A6H285_NEOLE|nr:hypothetical protein A6R68_12949 [Neotoma lepida]